MMILLWALLLLGLYTLQTSWFLFFHTSQSPDLLLVLLLLTTLEEGPKGGLSLGFVIGALQDVISFSFFGYHIVTRTLLGGMIGLMRGNIFKDQLPTFAVVVALVSIMVKAFHLAFLMFYQGEIFSLWPFVLDAGKYVGWNVVCSVPMWIISRVIIEILKRRQQRYYRM